MNTSKFLRKALGLSALPLLLALSTTQPGCLAGRGPSEVARGQRYESGDPTYDQFFGLVHDLSVDLGKAPSSEAKIRTELGKQLGVEVEDEDEPAPQPAKQAAAPATEAPATSPSPTDAYEDQLKQAAINAVPGGATVNAVSQQVKQAQATFGQLSSLFGSSKTATTPERTAEAPKPKAAPKAPGAALIAKAVKAKAQKLGLEMKLAVDRSEDGSEAKLSTRAAPEGEAKQLAELVQEAAKRELALLGRMNAAKKKLAKLESLSGALEANVDTAFRKSRGQASEVRKNLDDARALIDLMQARVDDVSKKADRMLSKLEEAASANIEAPAEQPPQGSRVATKQATEPKAQGASKAAQAESATTESTKPAKAKSSAKPEPKKTAVTTPRQPRANALGDFEP